MLTNLQLSEHFWLFEFLQSQTATRYGFNEQYEPKPAIVQNLKALCVSILQPIRQEIGSPLLVSSGYRCPRLNRAVGGAPKSQHTTGNAADIQSNHLGNKRLFEQIQSSDLPFDQLINEFNYAWVHVSYDPKRNRRQVLEAYNDSRFGVRYRVIQ